MRPPWKESLIAAFLWLLALLWVARKQLRVLWPPEYWRDLFISGHWRSKPSLGTGIEVG